MQIGELILLYRKEHKLSQRQFAKKCGDISNGYISMLENNLNPATNKGITPTIDKLKLIAHAMDMSLDDLFKATDDTLVSLKRDSAEDVQNPTNDDDLLELREAMRRNPEVRILFSATKGAKKEHIKAAAAMLEALKANDGSME